MKRSLLFLLIISVSYLFAGDLKKETISVDGMTCNACVEKVSSALKAVDGVKSVDVSLEKAQAVVEYDGEDTKVLSAAIVNAGFNTGAVKVMDADHCNTAEGKSACCSGNGKCADKKMKTKKEI